MNIFSRIKERYMDWRYPTTKHQRRLEAWLRPRIFYPGRTPKEYFCGFKFVVRVNYDSVYSGPYDGMFGRSMCQDFKAYLYPTRSFEEGPCIALIDRGLWNKYTGEFEFNGLGGDDEMFVATNNEDDVIMLALRFG